MTVQELKDKGALYLENVEEGLRTCKNEVRVMEAFEAYRTLTALCEKHGWENAYVDFYYHTLDEEAQECIEASLEEEEVEYLREKCGRKAPDDLIFSLDPLFLRIVAKLNAREILFSTIYFVGEERSTWWGNFNKEYIVFEG